MQQQAVLDRIVDGLHAVLLVGPDEIELIIPASRLPDGVTDGAWLRLELDGDTVTAIALDPEATAAAQARIDDKLAQLRARGRKLP